MDLSFEQERLTEQFAGVFSAEIVTECVEGCARAMISGARITSYIPLLAKRSARNHLNATLRHTAPE